MSKPRLMLKPPPKTAPDLAKRLWLASGPGRAWRWNQWAKAIRPDDSRYEFAQSLGRRVAEIMRWYRKGATDYATLQLERLTAEARRLVVERERTRTQAGKGGKTSALKKKRDAEAWHKVIEHKARRFIAGGKSASNIGALLAPEVGKGADTVRRFAAQLRGTLTTRKK